MANDLASAVDKILAQGLMVLRSQCVMPALVNSSYGAQATQFGDSIQIPSSATISVEDVAPSATPTAAPDVILTHKTISLNRWRKTSFYMTDKEAMEVQNGTAESHVNSAMAALAADVNGYILGLYTGVYGIAGTIGADPFVTTVGALTAAQAVLENQYAPAADRWIVLNPAAQANAMGLSQFTNLEFGATAQDIREGKIGRRLGFNWRMDQQVPRHVNSGGTPGSSTAFLVDQADHAIGDTTIAVDDGATGQGDPVPIVGDIFTVAGDSQTYTVSGWSAPTITYSPAAKVAWAENAAVTWKAAHAVNMAFQRGAIGFANRPILDSSQGLGNIIQYATDKVSGLSLRLEVERQNKQTKWEFDILYGAELIQPELACRIIGA